MVPLPADHGISARGHREPYRGGLSGEGESGAADIRREGWKVHVGADTVHIGAGIPGEIREMDKQSLMDILPLIAEVDP